jgi:hypothetical protein
MFLVECIKHDIIFAIIVTLGGVGFLVAFDRLPEFCE